MKLIYTNRILNRLSQLFDEVAKAGELDYHDRLREFKNYCDGTLVLVHCLSQLPQGSYDFRGKIDHQLLGNEKGYAIRRDAIGQIVSDPRGVDRAWEQLNIYHGGPKTKRDALPVITQLFVTPIYHYLIDQLEASSTMLYILLRYKRWAEWFEAERLRKVYECAGEGGLDCDLRRFLFESGIDYPYSQPHSPGGRADIVAELGTDDPLVLEVKVWDSTKDYKENRCRDGLRQVMDYATKYGKDRGYVVVFNLDPVPLEFVSPQNTGEWPPRLEHGSRTYYFIAFDIVEQREPVSERDKGKPVKTNVVQLAELLD